MPTIAERVLAALAADGPLDDDELAGRLGVRRQAVNPVTRRLAEDGRVSRYTGPGGKFVNTLPGDQRIVEAPKGDDTPVPRPAAGILTEDEVKTAVRDHLQAEGYKVVVAWGRTRGIDIEATHPTSPRLIVEAKGAVDSDQQQGSYFLGALGELLQRMDDPAAVYALALPANRRYQGLVHRLPRLARARLTLRVYWVHQTPEGPRVVVEDS